MFDEDLTDNAIEHFVYASLICIAVFILMKLIIPDVPKRYRTLKKRHNHIAKKVLTGFPLQD